MASRRMVLGLLAGAGAAQAQEAPWPGRGLRIVVPYGPGGTNDIAARLLAQHLSETLGQPAVVENRPGAQAALGTEAVARARPDGLTLLVAASGPIVFNPATDPRLSYNPLVDLAPITPLASYPLLLVVAADSPWPDLAALLAHARANPERANFGSPAASMQLATELLNQRAGTRFSHVGYRGSVEVATAVAAGQVSMALLDPAPVAPLIAAGRLRPLAVTAASRMAEYPAVPTLLEAGFPGMVVEFWAGLLAPAGTPPAILARLHAEATAMMATPGYRQRMAALHSSAQAESASAFRGRIERETTLWRGVAQQGGIRLER